MAQPIEKIVRASERPRRRTARLDGQGVLDAALERASWEPRTDGRSIDVEIAHNEKLLRDLVTGIRNLRQFAMREFDYPKRDRAQAAKIQSVQEKLFKLKQGRLL